MTNFEATNNITLSFYDNTNDNRQKLQDFLNWFNSIYRLSIFTTESASKEEHIYLLLSLKKCIKWALTELNHVKKSRPYNFSCNICDEVISLSPNEDFWSGIQKHEHFEEILSGSQTYTMNMNNSINNVHVKEVNALADTLNETKIIDTRIMVNGSNEDNPTNSRASDDSDDSSSESNFKFSFPLMYHEIVQTNLYTPSLMNDVRKIDKLENYAIQKCGKNRGVCLLCSCDLLSTKNLSKKSIIDHVFGQRHLRFASNPTQVAALAKYHETFLNLETTYQCHQVYFMPDIGTVKCNLCKTFIKYSDVQNHIDTDPHKSKVIQNLERHADYKLLNYQVDIYGITVKEEPKQEVKEKKKVEKTDRERSNSSTDKEPLTHNIIKSVNSATSTNILDSLPNRFKEHTNVLKVRKNEVFCNTCKKVLPSDISVITSHIQQLGHLKNSNIKTQQYTYFCEICNNRFTEESAWQNHHLKGPNRHGMLTEIRKEKVVEYECTTCHTIIFGDELSLSRHLNVQIKKGAKKELKLPPKIKQFFLNKRCIYEFGRKLTEEANDVLDDKALNISCCKAIEQLLSTTFPGCKAYPFGSRISGLGNYESDLDVFLDTGGMYDGEINQDPQDQVQFVKKADRVFRKSKDDVLDVVCIPTARTPIVKLYHIKTELDCDISFRHGLSVENTKFLRYCMTIQPITQTLILILKQWSYFCQLNEHISTYALAMLVIFYLQTRKYLPSVKLIRELNSGTLAVIDGWETINYSAPLEDIKSQITSFDGETADILIDLFQYYFNFDYTTLVICPLLGRTLSKKFFTEHNGEYLPEEMKSYKEKQKHDGEQFRALSPFCIQDPFDLSHNLTKACQLSVVNKFKTYCDLSVKTIQKN